MRVQIPIVAIMTMISLFFIQQNSASGPTIDFCSECGKPPSYLPVFIEGENAEPAVLGGYYRTTETKFVAHPDYTKPPHITIGFGWTQDPGNPATALKKRNMHILSNEECNDEWHGSINDEKICAKLWRLRGCSYCYRNKRRKTKKSRCWDNIVYRKVVLGIAKCLYPGCLLQRLDP